MDLWHKVVNSSLIIRMSPFVMTKALNLYLSDIKRKCDLQFNAKCYR